MRVSALWVVEHFDIIKHSMSRVSAGFVFYSPDFFFL